MKPIVENSEMVREYDIIRASEETNQLMFDNSKTLERIFEKYKLKNKYFTLDQAQKLFMSMEHDNYQPTYK